MLQDFAKINFNPGTAKSPITGQPLGYEYAVGEKDWKKYLGDFTNVYKNSTAAEREVVRGGLGARFWQTLINSTQRKGLLNTKDIQLANAQSSARSME